MACSGLLLVVAAAAVTAQSHTDAKTAAFQDALQKKLTTIAETVDGVMGYEVVDLTTGARFGRLRGEVFPTASTIKLAILYELFKQVDEAKLRLDEPRPLEARHRVGGAGVLGDLTAPSLPMAGWY